MDLIADLSNLDKRVNMNFATIYDYFQKDIDLDQLLKPILPFLDQSHLVIDAGCGSGHILTYLSQKGFMLIGVDNDSTMLALAQQKIIEHKLNAKLFEHDLKSTLPVKVYQIISLLDVVHYFKGAKGLFKNYYHALENGGTLIIDLYKNVVNEHEEGQIGTLEYDWLAETKGNLIKHTLTVLVDNAKYVFNQKQYYYPLSYYLDLLQQIGFKVQLVDSFDDRKINLVCKK